MPGRIGHGPKPSFHIGPVFYSALLLGGGILPPPTPGGGPSPGSGGPGGGPGGGPVPPGGGGGGCNVSRRQLVVNFGVTPAVLPQAPIPGSFIVAFASGKDSGVVTPVSLGAGSFDLVRSEASGVHNIFTDQERVLIAPSAGGGLGDSMVLGWRVAVGGETGSYIWNPGNGNLVLAEFVNVGALVSSASATHVQTAGSVVLAAPAGPGGVFTIGAVSASRNSSLSDTYAANASTKEIAQHVNGAGHPWWGLGTGDQPAWSASYDQPGLGFPAGWAGATMWCVGCNP